MRTSALIRMGIGRTICRCSSSLRRREIDKLIGQTREKGLTLIPTKMYLKGGRIKCEFAVAKGKKLHDKREAAREREMQDEARAAMGRRRD